MYRHAVQQIRAPRQNFSESRRTDSEEIGQDVRERAWCHHDLSSPCSGSRRGIQPNPDFFSHDGSLLSEVAD